MSPEVLQVYKQCLAKYRNSGPVLEIGATPKTALIDLPELHHHDERIAINADPHACNARIMHLNSHDLSDFADEHFSMILCNAVWEHDLFFWQSLKEITRLCQARGLLILGLPSFGAMQQWQNHLGYKKHLLRFLLPREWQAASLTLGLHHYPDDFYRFSASAIRQLLKDDWQILEQIECMQAPRLITVAQRS